MTGGDRPVVSWREHVDDEGHHVWLSGRIDVRTVPDLRITMKRIVLEGASPVLLDLNDVEIGDATGLGFFVEMIRCAARHGRVLLIVAAGERTGRLLRRARQGHVLVAEPLTVGTLTAW